MKELIDRKALIAEYDRVHIGPPGGARKLMEDAPIVDAVTLPCKIGDTVYFHHIAGVNEDGSPIEEVRSGQIYQICIEANNEIWIRVSFGIWYCCRRYTDFYFSKEEADANLYGERKDDGK